MKLFFLSRNRLKQDLKSTSMKNVFFLGFLFFIAACNNSSKSNNPDSTLLQTNINDQALILNSAVIDSEALLPANSFTVIETSENTQFQNNFYTRIERQEDSLGCYDKNTTVFQNSSKFNRNAKSIDASLRIDDKFIKRTIFNDIQSGYDFSVRLELKNKIKDTYSYDYNMIAAKDIKSNINFDLNTLFTSTPHGVVTYSNGIQLPLKKIFTTPLGYNLINNYKLIKSSNTYWNCFMSSKGASNQKVSLINYQLGKRKVEAILEVASTNGQITCDLKEIQVLSSSNHNSSPILPSSTLRTVTFGNGLLISKVIATKRIKSAYLVPCEGEKIYQSQRLLVNGKTLHSLVSKLESAPLR